MKKNWQYRSTIKGKDKDTESYSVAPQTAHDTVLQSVLKARGFNNSRDIDEYLNPRLIDLYSPFLFEGMGPAVERIKQALSDRETIGIFSDSDLDGITSLVVLHTLFTKMKAKLHMRHLQNEEQYGLTNEIVREFIDAGVSLLITVDSGTRDIKEIDHAIENGIDVIVTDHHEPDTKLPNAIIINPKLQGSQYPFKDLAGVGVACKLCIGILLGYLASYNKNIPIVARENDRYSIGLMQNGVLITSQLNREKDDCIQILRTLTNNYSFIITDCDESKEAIVAALPGLSVCTLPNLVSTINGGITPPSLEQIYKMLMIDYSLYDDTIKLMAKIAFYLQIAGSQKIMGFLREILGFASIGSIADVVPLIGENRILVKHGFNTLDNTNHPGLSLILNNGPVNSRKIGWSVAPFLNTPGRVGKTALTLNFFLENDIDRVQSIIDEITILNDDRKNQIKDMTEQLLSSPQIVQSPYLNMFVIKSELIPEGYAGLVANRLSELLGKPVIVIVTQKEKDVAKGSGRCRNGIDFFSFMKPVSDRFIRIGGHAQAFGFTIQNNGIDPVMAQIDEGMNGISNFDIILSIDYALSLSAINMVLVESFEAMEPFGKGNDIPLFITRGLQIQSFSRFGNGNHGKYTFKENDTISMIGWNKGDEMSNYFLAGEPVDIVYTLEKNEYRGRSLPRLQIADISASSAVDQSR